MCYLGSVFAEQPTGSTESNEVDAILKEITSKRLAHSSLTYSSERLHRWGDQANPESMAILCNHEEVISKGEIQSRAECEQRQFKGNIQHGGVTRSYSVDDGKHRYDWIEDGDVVGKKVADSLDDQTKLIGFLQETYKLSVVQKHVATNPDSITALEGTSNQSDDPTPTLRLEFNQRGLLTRHSKHNKEGAITFDFIIRNTRYDVPVNPDRVIFVKPSGMRIEEWETGKGLGVTKTGKQKSN